MLASSYRASYIWTDHRRDAVICTCVTNHVCKNNHVWITLNIRQKGSQIDEYHEVATIQLSIISYSLNSDAQFNKQVAS